MMIKFGFLLVVLGLTSVGCFDVFEPTYWKEGKYFIKNNPAEPSCKVLYRDLDGAGISRVTCIVQIGSDSNFILSRSGEDTYWVLDKKRDRDDLNAEEIVEGPLNFEQFRKRTSQLGADNIKLHDF